MSPLDRQVADTFGSFEPEVRNALLTLRSLILSTAVETDGVGRVEETLKWGQPSYLTPETNSGSTIRIAPITSGSKASSGPDDNAPRYAMFFICHTNLVEQFEGLFGDTFSYDGGRALLFSLDEQLPEDELRQCIAMALTYHLGGHVG